MRNVIYKIAACSALVALVLSGCKESFLEEDPNGYISSDQIKENAVWNPNIMLGQALGTYSTTFAWQTGGTTNHDDFGQKSIDIATDLMSGDLAMSGETYGWFSDAARLQCNTTTKNRTYMLWRYYYRIIKACNEIFDTVGGDESVPANEDNQNYYAQAKALRASRITTSATTTRATVVLVLPTISGKMCFVKSFWNASGQSMSISEAMWTVFRRNGCNAAGLTRSAASGMTKRSWNRQRNALPIWMSSSPGCTRTMFLEISIRTDTERCLRTMKPNRNG